MSLSTELSLTPQPGDTNLCSYAHMTKALSRLSHFSSSTLIPPSAEFFFSPKPSDQTSVHRPDKHSAKPLPSSFFPSLPSFLCSFFPSFLLETGPYYASQASFELVMSSRLALNSQPSFYFSLPSPEILDLCYTWLIFQVHKNNERKAKVPRAVAESQKL